MYANVLIGLSLLLQEKQRPPSNGNGQPGEDTPARLPIEDRVEQTCRALAPFILALTSLGQEDLSDGEQIDGLEAAG